MTPKMKLLVGALGFSLVLNVFSIGFFVGKGARTAFPGREHMQPPPPADINFRRLERNIPPEKRAEVRRLLREKGREIRKGYRALREIEQEIKSLVLAETVDRAALKKVLAKHSEQARVIHSPMRWVLLETIAGLELETRKKIVEDMFKGRRKKKMYKERPPKDQHKKPDEQTR